MKREDAFKLLTKYLTNQNLIKHCLAAEATMHALYTRLYPAPTAGVSPQGKTEMSIQEFAAVAKAEQDKWGITGLLHDADYEMAKGHPEEHGILLFRKEPNVVPSEIAYAIKSHNYQYTKVQPVSKMDWAITCCDQLTGLVVAAALVHPDKKLAPITSDFILKRFNEKSFARGADRKTIQLCEEKLGIPLKEFIDITLNAMKGISNQLGL